MNLGMDRFRDEMFELPDGQVVFVRCKWVDGPGHTVASAEVTIETPQLSRKVIGIIEGPLSQAEANSKGREIARGWFETNNG